MSDFRQNITAWFLDFATRHPLIRHTAAVPHFFEADDEYIIQNAAPVAMQGWNLLLLEHKDALRDNGGDYISETTNLYFLVLTHVEQGDAAAMKAAFVAAKKIGYDLVAKLRADSCIDTDGENDLPAGITPPHFVDLNSVETETVGHAGLYDHSYGVQVKVMVRGDESSQDELDMTRDRVTMDPLP